MTFDFAGWDQRERRRRGLANAAVQHAGGQLPAAARVCREHGATTCWVFGSLVWGGFSPVSDVDLAVEGVPANAQTHLWSALERLFGRDVDRIDMGTAPARFAARIRAEGEILGGLEEPPASDLGLSK